MASKKLNPSGSINKKDLLAFFNSARWNRWSATATIAQLELFCRANEADSYEQTDPTIALLIDAEPPR